MAEAVFIDSIPYDIILNSKAEYRHNSLVRHRIEFKGAIWQDSIEQTEKDNTEVVPSKPPTDTEGASLFSQQFKQVKLKRKRDKQLVPTNTTDTNDRIYPNSESTNGIEHGSAPEKLHIHQLCDLIPNDKSASRVKLYVKGTQVKALTTKRRKTSANTCAKGSKILINTCIKGSWTFYPRGEPMVDYFLPSGTFIYIAMFSKHFHCYLDYVITHWK